MTNTQKTLRQAKALLKLFAKARMPSKESPYVKMARVIVGASK
jgi:hypothetical protein